VHEAERIRRFRHPTQETLDERRVLYDQFIGTYRLSTRAHVLCGDGGDFLGKYRAEKAFPQQMALVQTESELGKSRCHFIPALPLPAGLVRSLLSGYAAENQLVPGVIVQIQDATSKGYPVCTVRTESNQDVSVPVPAPVQDGNVLLTLCRGCHGSDEVACDRCNATGVIICQGTYTCRRCKGNGTLADGKMCLCRSGRISGCEGRKQFTCALCSGNGYFPCESCNGSGHFTDQCRRCGGTGAFGSGDGYTCNGTGWYQGDCYTCNGTGRFRTCYYCHGSANVPCTICHGSGNLKCPKCVGKKMNQCPYGHGNLIS
jgi:hypothetical protein